MADREVLVDFFHATGGSSWTNKNNWCSDRPLREWYGVECDDEGNVVKLNLNSNNLRGKRQGSFVWGVMWFVNTGISL